MKEYEKKQQILYNAKLGLENNRTIVTGSSTHPNTELYYKDKIVGAIAKDCLSNFDEGHIIALLNTLISNGLIIDPRQHDSRTFSIYDFAGDITSLGLLFLDYLQINERG